MNDEPDIGASAGGQGGASGGAIGGQGASPLIRVLGDRAEAQAVLAGRAAARDQAREARRRVRAERSEWRLWLICLFMLVGYGLLAGRMTLLAAAEPREPRLASSRDVAAEASRAAIVDREGRILASNLPTWAIYAHPTEMKKAGVAAEDGAHALAGALPGIDEAALRKRFETRKGLVWVKRPVSPAEKQAVHDLGLPGVHFGRRETRLYPAGRIAAHILGGVRVGRESVTHAELLGRAGVERALDETLRDPARAGAPLRLTIDLSAQTALTRVIEAAIAAYDAKAGAATLMNARNGEIIAMVSLPDFDPNDRPDPNDPAVKRVRPMMNRAAEGVYEFGSTFKIFAAAQAMEMGLARPSTLIETKGPLRIHGHRIGDIHKMPPQMPLRDVIVESSNVGTARLADMIGPKSQRAFLERLGLLKPVEMEIAETRLGAPLIQPRWNQLEAMTISYGHGLSVTQLHLAAAYAAMVNGGLMVRPTLLHGAAEPAEEDRVIGADTSRALREMMRAVVVEEKGTANFAEAPGYEVGGKTGTADKATAGGYARRKTLSTFAGAWPMSNPEYVIVITLDEAKTWKYGREWRTAGWTAAPTAGAAVKRLAPILGLRPAPRTIDLTGVSGVVGGF